jgi:hypothetical protein
MHIAYADYERGGDGKVRAGRGTSRNRRSANSLVKQGLLCVIDLTVYEGVITDRAFTGEWTAYRITEKGKVYFENR